MKRNPLKSARSFRTSAGARIIAGLTSLRDVLRSGDALEKHFTSRTLSIVKPETFSRERVKRLRKTLRVSQSLFAQLLGVSTVLVQSWEQGLRKPSQIACRLMVEIEREPVAYIRRHLKGAA
jgi:putative transcriptional regulator